MNDKRTAGRRPAAFTVPDSAAKTKRPEPSVQRTPSQHTEGIVMTPVAEDPFADTTIDLTTLPPLEEAQPRRRRFTLGGMAAAVTAALVAGEAAELDPLLRQLEGMNEAEAERLLAAGGELGE